MRSPYIVAGYAFYWRFPSEAERISYVGTLAEEGRIAWQRDNNSLWFLSSAPSIWTRIGATIVSEPGEGNPSPPVVGTSYIARGPISGHKAVAAYFNHSVIQASSDDTSIANSVLGISVNAAIDAAPVTVISSGEIIEPTWNWIPDMPIFVGRDGKLTQTPPSEGFQLIIAVATSQQSIAVGIKQPIIL